MAILYVQWTKEKNYVAPLVCRFLFIDCGRVLSVIYFSAFWDISERVLVMQRYIVETIYRCITSVCEKYYFAEQRDVLFIDVNVCLCLVWGRRQTTWNLTVPNVFLTNSARQSPTPLFTPYCMERYLAQVTLLKLLLRLRWRLNV